MWDDRFEHTMHDIDALIRRMKELSEELRNSAKEIELHGNQRDTNSNTHPE